MNPNALKPLSPEDHEANSPYHVGGILNLGSATDADVYFNTTPKPIYPSSWIFNQGEFEAANDECGGVSGSRVLSFLNGYNCGPHFLWMMARQGAGEKIGDYGISNRDLANTMRHIGALRMEDEVFSFKDGRDVIQDPTKWPPLDVLTLKAQDQVVGSVIWIIPHDGMDAFDTYRATLSKLNKMYGKTHAAVFGLLWAWPMSQISIDNPSETGSGHDIPLYWAEGDYAIALQSYGLSAGHEGEQKIHRSIINKWAQEYGMFVSIDATKEEIDAVKARGGKLNDPWLTNIVYTFVDVTKKLHLSIKNYLVPILNRLFPY